MTIAPDKISAAVVVIEAHTFVESLEVPDVPIALQLYGNGSTIAPNGNQTNGALGVIGSELEVIFDGTNSAESQLVRARESSILNLRDVSI